MITFHEKYFLESIPYEQVNPSGKQSNDFRNIHDIENKLTRFQIYQETEIACKYGKKKFDPYATSHSLNEGTSYIAQVNLVENLSPMTVEVHVYKNYH